MSWDGYVSQSLLGTGVIDQAVIVGIDGLGKWAGSPGFEPTAAELQEISSAFKDTAVPKAIQSNGFHIGGVKYITVKAEDQSLYGMKGKEGIICCKSKLAIIVAHYPQTVQAGQAANVVESLATYLVKNNY